MENKGKNVENKVKNVENKEKVWSRNNNKLPPVLINCPTPNNLKFVQTLISRNSTASSQHRFFGYCNVHCNTFFYPDPRVIL